MEDEKPQAFIISVRQWVSVLYFGGTTRAKKLTSDGEKKKWKDV